MVVTEKCVVHDTDVGGILITMLVVMLKVGIGCGDGNRW